MNDLTSFTARYSVIGIVHHETPDTLHGIGEGLEDRGSAGGGRGGVNNGRVGEQGRTSAGKVGFR
jgi:hypothetical protein